MTMETIYRDKANGTIEYFVYSDGERVTVSRPWAEDQMCRGRARYVDLDKAHCLRRAEGR